MMGRIIQGVAIVMVAGCLVASNAGFAADTVAALPEQPLTGEATAAEIAKAFAAVRQKTHRLAPAPQQSPSPAAATAASLAAGVTIPMRRLEIEQVFASIGVDAVYFATIQSGNTRIVGNGTITELGQDQYSYAPEPKDRLRINFAAGPTVEYQFDSFRGDYSQPDGARFLRRDHDIGFRFESSWGTNVVVRMQRAGRQYLNTVKGRVADGKSLYDVATQTKGTIVTDVGGSSAEYDSREQVEGTASAGDIAVSIREAFRYHLLVFENTIEDVQHDISNAWQIGTERYALPDGHIFRTFKNGAASELDSWKARGVLTRNGQQAGGLSQRQNMGRIETVLKTDQGEAVLYSDLAR
jgi:hypothetical protein